MNSVQDYLGGFTCKSPANFLGDRQSLSAKQWIDGIYPMQEQLFCASCLSYE
jgi:hypothetical protein